MRIRSIKPEFWTSDDVAQHDWNTRLLFIGLWSYVDDNGVTRPGLESFLAEQGIRLRRIPSWPDYFDAPGASIPGRTVVSDLFDIRRLGEWRARLRPGFLPLPAHLDEAMQLPLLKRSKAAKKVLLRILAVAAVILGFLVAPPLGLAPVSPAQTARRSAERAIAP